MSRALTEYHDFLAYVTLFAPSDFPEEDYLQPHEQITLDKAFSKLRNDFGLVRERVKDENTLTLLRELLEMSYEHYSHGDDVKGAHIIQEFETLIWPSRGAPIDYSPIALQRIKERTSA
jgi:hypothetical protein